MRLKFLFFPIMLVVSVAVFIGFIWPEIGTVKKINEEKLASNAKLQEIKGKQAMIESIDKKITDSAEVGDVVLNYLPTDKVEERVIGSVNYLASDANVSLVNIALISPKNPTALPNAVAVDPATGLAPSVPSTIDPMTGQLVPLNVNPVQDTTFKISLIGDYEKIKIFLENLQRMPIINTIKSVNIAKQKSNAAADATPEANLAADIEVDFEYLSVAKVNGQEAGKFNPELDNNTIDSLKKYISQKSQAIGTAGDAKGKTNPFLIN